MTTRSDSPLFSVTLDDCDVQTFTVSGAGGQHRDRAKTGVRIVHRASGAVGEARDNREQKRNKRNAFIRMTDTPEFRFWLDQERKRLEGEETALARIERELADPETTVVEVRRNGEWVREGTPRGLVGANA